MVLADTGEVTVAGYTESSDFPTTPDAYDTSYNGGGDAFVARLDPSLTGTDQLVWSTFLGASINDMAIGKKRCPILNRLSKSVITSMRISIWPDGMKSKETGKKRPNSGNSAFFWATPMKNGRRRP